MINTIQADIYRLFHSVSFKLTELFLVIFIVGAILSQQIAVIAVSYSSSISTSSGSSAWTALQTLFNFTQMSNFIIYFCLSIFVITVGHDLTKATVKNLLTAGVSRAQFFISKYIVFILMTILQFLLFYGFAFIVTLLLHGPGNMIIISDGPNVTLVTGFKIFTLLISALGAQLLFIQAIFAIGFLVLYLSFSTVWAVLSITFFPILIGVIGVLVKPLRWLSYFDFQSAMVTSSILPRDRLDKIVLSAVATLLVLASLSYLHFSKKDL